MAWTELMALRFLFLNPNSCVCLRFRCSESGEGTDGGEKSDSNRVLPGLIASLYFHLCVYRISFSLSLLLSPFPRRLSLSFIASLFRSVCVSLSFFLFLDKWVGAWKLKSNLSKQCDVWYFKNKPYAWQYLKWAFLLTCQHLVKSFCFYILY